MFVERIPIARCPHHAASSSMRGESRTGGGRAKGGDSALALLVALDRRDAADPREAHGRPLARCVIAQSGAMRAEERYIAPVLREVMRAAPTFPSFNDAGARTRARACAIKRPDRRGSTALTFLRARTRACRCARVWVAALRARADASRWMVAI